MKYLLVVVALGLSGCATYGQGYRDGKWEDRVNKIEETELPNIKAAFGQVNQVLASFQSQINELKAKSSAPAVAAPSAQAVSDKPILGAQNNAGK
jgi:hypothetical protein